MLIHSMLPRSAVNGPGERAVVWLQGCALHCPGCWNRSTHRFDSARTRPVEEVGEWILSCPDVEGDQIRQFLDFGVLGRFRESMACRDKPLCGSRNQEVVFFTNRYSQRDLEPQGYEVNISSEGTLATITGFPPLDG